jgi:ABC-type antimicrobial peptide transport system permease subunit
VRSDGLDKPALEAVYFPLVPLEGAPLWSPLRGMSVVVRTRTERPELLAASVRRILADIDPAVPLANVQTLETVVARSMARTSFAMLLLAVAAGMALVLSAVGIYGVISYIVGQRRSEIGIRIALGARVTQVVRLVVGQSLALAGMGVAIGLVAATIATRLLRSLLFEVQPGDPIVLVAVTALLIALASLASLAPARRAARVDPTEALRGD